MKVVARLFNKRMNMKNGKKNYKCVIFQSNYKLFFVLLISNRFLILSVDLLVLIMVNIASRTILNVKIFY